MTKKYLSLVIVLLLGQSMFSQLVFLEEKEDTKKEEIRMVRTMLNSFAKVSEKAGGVCDVSQDLSNPSELGVHCLFKDQDSLKKAFNYINSKVKNITSIELRTRRRGIHYFDFKDNQNLIMKKLFDLTVAGYKLKNDFEVCTSFTIEPYLRKALEAQRVLKNREIYSDELFEFVTQELPTFITDYKSYIYSNIPQDTNELNDAQYQEALKGFEYKIGLIEITGAKDVGLGKTCIKNVKKFMNKERDFDLSEYIASTEASTLLEKQILLNKR